MAIHFTSPRADETFTCSPFLIPFSLARISPISTYTPGMHLQKPGLPPRKRPGAPMLRTGIGCAHIGKFPIRVRHFVQITLEYLDGGIDQLTRQRIFRQRPFQGFIVFRERTFRHAGPKECAHSIGFHNERILAFLLIRHGRPWSVRDVPHPFFSLSIPESFVLGL